MKVLFQKSIFVILLLLVLVACDKTTTQTNPALIIATSLKVSIDSTQVIANGYNYATVTIKDQNNTDVTNYASIYIDSTIVSSKEISFDPSQGNKTYYIYATKNSVKSDSVKLKAILPPPSKFTTKILLEDYMATWSGWSPRLTYKIQQYKLNNPKIFSSSVHYLDTLSVYPYDSILRSNYGITYTPSTILNRKEFFGENGDINSLADSTNFNSYLTAWAAAGLAIESSVTGNSLKVVAKVNFDLAIKDSLRLVVLLTENNVIAPQKNYYNLNSAYPGNPYFNSGDPIVAFSHQAVLRQAGAANALGETITAASQVKGGTFTSPTYSFDISKYNLNNLNIVAFVQYAPNQGRRGILNVQGVKAGLNKNFD